MGFRPSPYKRTGTVITTGSQIVAGPIRVESDGDAATVDAVHISSEISTPSAPADGNGGILYVKSDGKPYWISNELSETDLSSGGGGGGDLGTVAGTVSASYNNYVAIYTGSAGQYDPTTGLTGSHSLVFDAYSGRLGIGTKDPQADLHVAGADSSMLFGVHSTSKENILVVTGSGRVSINPSSVASNPTAEFNVRAVGNSNILKMERSDVSGVEMLVRISTDCEWNVNNRDLLVVHNYGENVRFSQNGAVRFSSSLGTSRLEITGSGNSTLFGVHSDSKENILVVTGSGKVGINTDSPDYFLDVKDTSNNRRFYVTGDVYIAGGTDLKFDTSNRQIKNEGGNMRLNSHPSYYIYLQDTSSNVAVGMPNSVAPTAKLHVSGSDGTALFKVSSNSNSNIVTIDSTHVSSSVNVSASAFYGDGTGITGITSTWSGGSVASTIRSTGQNNPSDGAGIELLYNSSGGRILSYDRASALWIDQFYGGREHVWQVNGTNQMFLSGSTLDCSGSILGGMITGRSGFRTTGFEVPTSGESLEFNYHPTLDGLIQSVSRPWGSDHTDWRDMNFHGATLKWKSYGNQIIVMSGSFIGLNGVTSPSYPIEHSSGAYLSSGGVWTDASSRSLKKNIKTLTQKDADAAFDMLEPVSFEYKTGSEKHLGFIAEDVHDLVATEDRKGLSSMDLIAVLTKVLKKQQKQISKLEEALSGKGK